MTADTTTWKPPGPGTWIADRSHGPPNPTRLFRRIATEGTGPAYHQAMREFGAPVASIEIAFVHGQMYRRVVPLVGARIDRGAPPPAPILWLVTRLHPAFRREERKAAATLADKTYLDGIERWYDTERDEWIATNRRLQAVDPGQLDDAGLADHLDDLNATLCRGWHRHHRLHAYDLGPIGDLIAHAQRWGLDTVETMLLLRGSSPATVEAAAMAGDIAAALADAGRDPSAVDSVDEIRVVPAAAEALDRYLDVFGWRVIVGYDIDGATLHELPSAVCGIVRTAGVGQILGTATDRDSSDPERYAALRAQCPEPERFDELVADARSAYGLRDDNGPLTWSWPAGLTRRAYLEAARRLVGCERLVAASDVFELDADELARVLRDPEQGPSATEIADRVVTRRSEGTLRGPDHLGAAPVEPGLGPLPPSLARIMAMIVAAVTLLEPDPEHEIMPLGGLGIGDRAYSGRACVVDNAADAIDRLEPGDVLVAPFTAPSFNAVLPMAGALVVQEGGLLCHAAVMARELELAAVVGCQGALDAIDDGDIIVVDPASNRVVLGPNQSPNP